MFGLGFSELIVIFLIALIFIGPKKLPELAKGLGQGLKEFQKAAKGFTKQMNDSVNEVKSDLAQSDLTHKLVEPVDPLDAPKQEEPKVVAETDSSKDHSQS